MYKVFESLAIILGIIYISYNVFIFFNQIKAFKENRRRKANNQKIEILKNTIKYAEEDNDKILINACKKQIEKIKI